MVAVKFATGIICMLSLSAAADESVLCSRWRFHRGDVAGAEAAGFDDGEWDGVSVPHDWAIAGPFDPALDGNTGKLPWRGRGTYETTITCAELPKGRVFLDFEGVMAHATVFANGNPCGRGDYGYLGFRADLTPYLMKGANKIVVKVDTDNFKSRWYHGGGI